MGGEKRTPGSKVLSKKRRPPRERTRSYGNQCEEEDAPASRCRSDNDETCGTIFATMASALSSGCPCHARTLSPRLQISCGAVADVASVVAEGGSDVTASPWDSNTVMMTSESALDDGNDAAADW
jgi:hypothetical protein